MKKLRVEGRECGQCGRGISVLTGRKKCDPPTAIICIDCKLAKEEAHNET